MELRLLKYFLTVAQEESITKAAEALHITQPTLSRQLTQLEDELDAKLLIRSNRRVELTKEGQLLAIRAKELLEYADRTERELRQFKPSVSGLVSIGTAGILPSSYIAKIISQFTQLYPHSEFYLYTSCAENIKERVDSGLSTFALLTEPIEATKYDFIRLRLPWVWSLLVPKTDPLAERENITIDELSHFPLIIPKRILIPPSQDTLLSFLYDANFSVVGTYNLNTSAQALVKEGVGYALAIYSEHCWLAKEIKVLPIIPQQPVNCVLVWKKNRVLDPTSQIFLDTTNEYFGC